MVLLTGEDVPRGQSLRARVFVVEMIKGQIDWTKMSICQRDAHAGHYAEAMSGFIAWLVPRYSKVQRAIRMLDDRWRAAATTSGQHPRVATTTGKLAVAFACWGMLRPSRRCDHEAGAGDILAARLDGASAGRANAGLVPAGVRSGRAIL